MQRFRNTRFDSCVEPGKVMKQERPLRTWGRKGLQERTEWPTIWLNNWYVTTSTTCLPSTTVHWSCSTFQLTGRMQKLSHFPSRGRTTSSLRIEDLSCFEKIYETILLDRLEKFVFTYNLIPDEQLGFMPGCSTTHQLNQTDGVCYIWFREKDDYLCFLPGL